jgi:hypothetical protein
MRVIQRLMGTDVPIQTLTVYEHTLHFRHGVADIEELTEREINRLRAFGFRVERDTGPRPPRRRSETARAVPETAETPASAETVAGETAAAQSGSVTRRTSRPARTR